MFNRLITVNLLQSVTLLSSLSYPPIPSVSCDTNGTESYTSVCVCVCVCVCLLVRESKRKKDRESSALHREAVKNHPEENSTVYILIFHD